MTIDGLYSRLNDPQVAYDQAYYPDFTFDHNGNPEWSNVVVKNGFITSFTANTFTPEIVNQTIDRRVTTSLIGLNAILAADCPICPSTPMSTSPRPIGRRAATMPS